MSVSRTVLLKSENGWQKFNSKRLVLVPLGHTSTTTEADILQVWSGKAVKAHHSENNLTLLPKTENADSASYIPPGRALQFNLEIHSMREEFIFFLTLRSSLKLSLSDLSHLYPLIESTQSYSCVVRPLDSLMKVWITHAINFFTQLMAFNCFPVWGQNKHSKGPRKQLYEMRYKAAFANSSQ